MEVKSAVPIITASKEGATMLFDRSLDGIGEAELQDLVTNTVAEDRQLEYKLAVPTNQRVDRIEFLKDTSALANTAGGDLVYGIQEGQNGNHTVAVSNDVVAAADADATKLRLENMM